MSVSSLFSDFRKNLSVSNADDISTKYCNITKRLNLDFWELESDTRNSLQIGSYGRHTAIDGVSDLDMVFELPSKEQERYKNITGNGPSVMLQDVRKSLLKRYNGSDIRADGQVVGVNFSGYRVEVLPAFLDKDGNYTHGDTNNGGSWKTTMPRPEIAAANEMGKRTVGVYKDAGKMLRAWKNKVGVGIGGLLIDTLAYNFFSGNDKYDNAPYADYPAMLVSLFTYLGGLEAQDYWYAPGSNQRVKCKAPFQSKARKAARRCQEAIDAEGEGAQSKLWRKVFGRQFPKAEALLKSESAQNVDTRDKEQFIEDQYPLDIRYDLELDCEISKDTMVETLQRALLLKRRVLQGRGLRFYVKSTNVPDDYFVFWKIRNRGEHAVRRGQLRGQLERDSGNNEKIERSTFEGNHYVEAYIVKDGVCVARERIAVPIASAA